MRIYNRKDFLSLPAGTFFCKGVEWCFAEMNIKGKSWSNDKYNDFFYTRIHDIDAFSSEELFDRYDEMLKTGKSYQINQTEQRDGLFEEESIYLVFEKDDLEIIKNYIDRFISNV